MNERIRQLLLEAQELAREEVKRTPELAKYAPSYAIPGTEIHVGLGLSYEKFAQLIVQECMRQVEEQYKPVLEDEGMMKDTHWDGYVQCGVDSYVAIREHFFGVEQ